MTTGRINQVASLTFCTDTPTSRNAVCQNKHGGTWVYIVCTPLNIRRQSVGGLPFQRTESSQLLAQGKQLVKVIKCVKHFVVYFNVWVH